MKDAVSVFHLDGWVYADAIYWTGTFRRTRFNGEGFRGNVSSVEDMLGENMSNRQLNARIYDLNGKGEL